MRGGRCAQSQKGVIWSSKKPAWVGSSSTAIRTTAPASASMPGMMCERTHSANTMLAQPRQVPSRTTRANRPRNSAPMPAATWLAGSMGLPRKWVQMAAMIASTNVGYKKMILG